MEDTREILTRCHCETDFYYPPGCPKCEPWLPSNMDARINEVLAELKRRKRAVQEAKRQMIDQKYWGTLV
jgi:hypothetical protein